PPQAAPTPSPTATTCGPGSGTHCGRRVDEAGRVRRSPLLARVRPIAAGDAAVVGAGVPRAPRVRAPRAQRARTKRVCAQTYHPAPQVPPSLRGGDRGAAELLRRGSRYRRAFEAGIEVPPSF